MRTARGYAAHTPGAPLAPFALPRREPGPHDVDIAIDFCGVCHSDLHQVRNEWDLEGIFPMVPGHEIVGRVAATGAAVRAFAVGDRVGVGVFIDSCRACPDCRAGLEQYCAAGMVPTYNGRDRDGAPTYGGYSERIVVDERYVLRVPTGIEPAAAAPLLCAGITTWSPLRHWQAGPGKTVGVLGLGGLGHMGVKFAHALGAHVVAFTTSPAKADDARRWGAAEVVVGAGGAAWEARAGSLDFLLDAVSAAHDVSAGIELLRRDGTLVLVGLPAQALAVRPFALVDRRRRLAGSAIGGIPETQEMLDFCAAHGIAADVQAIPIQQVNEAYERLLRGQARYRFVIDLASLRA
ncbi:MAG: NAD(P)-dependent alcohol dehydrogenase [Planctomycetes bacterium]|nr:NAD(P)-dependent alcohol dehydrogenase [Planctomycetota bacterium]